MATNTTWQLTPSFLLETVLEVPESTSPLHIHDSRLVGHMSIAMMQMSIARQLPTKILELVLFYPVTDVNIELESYRTFRDAPFLPADTLRWMINTFIPNIEDRKTALASPLTFLPDETLAKFPPTIIILADVDPLIEDGRSFGRRLQQLGVKAAVIRGEGQMHAFVLAKLIRDSPTARAMVELAALKMRRAFVRSTPKV